VRHTDLIHAEFIPTPGQQRIALNLRRETPVVIGSVETRFWRG
jgi:hypothetical protein